MCMVVPQALLFRDMNFAGIAKGQVLGSVCGALVAVSMALGGAGVWSLVAQPLVGSTANLIIMLREARWRPTWRFGWVEVQPMMRFSYGLLGTSIVSYLGRNLDGVLIGRLLGAAVLGLYSMSIQFMLYPLQQVSAVFARVLFPALANLSPTDRRYRDLYFRAVGAIVIVTAPLMVGLCVVADDFVAVVLGDEWTPIVPLLRWLAWAGLLQSVTATAGSLYLSSGRTAQMFRATVAGTVVLLIGIAAGLKWGVLGVAIGYTVATIAIFYLLIHQAFQGLGFRISELHKVMARPLSCALMMGIVLLGINDALISLGPTARLLCKVVGGAGLYVVFAVAVNRSQVMEIFNLLRQVVLRRAGS